MLVFNDHKPTAFITAPSGQSNAHFFESVAKKVGPGAPAILLAGGSDFASWTARVQQAVVRFDRRPSDFSHAALICEWNVKVPARSWGLQLDPIHVPASQQRPEHAGVTKFSLADYLDDAAFPNLAIIHVPPVSAGQLDAVVKAARTPLRDAVRFPFMRWLAAWRAFVTAPETTAHPLLNRTPHPGAAFVAMAYEAAEVSLLPGALDMQHCPELLWGNAKHWGSAVGTNVKIYRRLRDEHAQLHKAERMTIALPGKTKARRKAR